MRINNKSSVIDKKRERVSNRWLLFLYDFLVLFCVYVFTYYVVKKISFNKFADPVEFFISFLIVTVLLYSSRSVFKVYRCVLRYGSVSAYARLVLADFIALVVYSIVQGLIFSGGSFLFEDNILFISLNFTCSLIIRIVYCFLFMIAGKNTKSGRKVEKFLRIFGLVDMESDDPSAVVKPFKESLNFRSDSELEVYRIFRQFDIHEKLIFIEKIDKGYINRTYHIQTLSEQNNIHNYILQRINTNVFQDVDMLMNNFVVVSEHLKGSFLLPASPKDGCVALIEKSKDGKPYYRDDSGTWRMTSFFENVCSFDVPDSLQTFYNAGKSFGGFLKAMSDLSFDKISVIIPNFHNTKLRYLALEESIKKDPVGRVKNVTEEIETVRSRKAFLGIIADALDSGKIPYRICHNDCNLNNILFNKDTHEPVAIIDLDTVMPSSPLYDFGDSMRIGTNHAVDDEPDLSKVYCDLELFEVYARGYLEACGDILTKEELELLPYAAQVITMEDGIRFLMDYIDGDTYYTIYYEDQNLRRSRTQLALAGDMINKQPEIRKILQKIYDELGFDVNILG